MKRNQAGFTLIELIIVIVILGILAVTAAPKFLDFGGDARNSVLQGVKGSLESAGSLVYGKAIIAGDQGDEDATVEGIPVTFGYPKATEVALVAAAELSDFEFGGAVAESIPGTPGQIRIGASADAVTDDAACYVLYTASSVEGVKPTITIVNTEC